MKIVFISDIHGNDEYLNVIDNIYFDELICLGDIGNSKAIEEWLDKYKNKLICLKGNCDFYNPYLFSNNDTISFTVDNINITCNHGHLYSLSKNYLNFKNVLIYGHEHVPYINKQNNKIFICVGSIGKPRNNFPPSYCTYENRTFTIYDIENNILDQIKIDAL